MSFSESLLSCLLPITLVPWRLLSFPGAPAGQPLLLAICLSLWLGLRDHGVLSAVTSTTPMGCFRAPCLMLRLWWEKTCLLVLLSGLHNCLVPLQLLKDALDLFSPLVHLIIQVSRFHETAVSVV